jgi:hypothetical protein
MIENMATKGRLVFFVLVGVTGLLLRGRYSGPWREVVHSYGGNLSVSFALYFVLAAPFLKHGRSRLIAAGTALAVVELFEILDGFRVMQNVYDPIDLAANAAGVALSLAVDAATCRLRTR